MKRERREEATHETPAAAGDYTLRALLLAEKQNLHSIAVGPATTACASSTVAGEPLPKPLELQATEICDACIIHALFARKGKQGTSVDPWTNRSYLITSLAPFVYSTTSFN